MRPPAREVERGELADGMEAARLYWIDPEFTDLTRHATGALPDTALERVDSRRVTARPHDPCYRRGPTCSRSARL